MRAWLSKRLPPEVFVVVWVVVMCAASLLVLAGWVIWVLDRTTGHAVPALVSTVVIGIPIALEWRHAGEVLRDT
jgi:hypothetical protein